MNWYKIAKQEYFYVTNCVNAKGEDIEKMIDNSVEIEWEEFNEHISNKEIRNALGDYGKTYDYDDLKSGSGLKFQDDYAVSFHKSFNYRGQPCYYFDWSAIEFVFLKGQ